MTHPTFDNATFELLSADGKLRMRPVRISDAPNLRDRCADPLNVKYLPHLQGKENQTVEDVEKWIQSVQAGFNKDSLFLVVEDTETNKVIGEGPLGYIDWNTKTAESGIMLDHQVTGKGVATNALKTSTDFAFKELGLNAVRFGTMKSNKAMVKVIQEKLPVNPEPQHNTRKDGLEEVNFTFTRDEWLAATS